MEKEIILEKRIYTEADFGQMGWHDCCIYKIRSGEDMELDIDYILKWNEPDSEGLPYTFWIVPATLVFKKIKNLVFELDTVFGNAIYIENIARETEGDTVLWIIETREGYFEFGCEGFELFMRQPPFFQFTQTIPYSERNGFSVERTVTQENANRFRDDTETDAKGKQNVMK